VGDVAAFGGLVEAAGVGQGLQVLQQFEVEFVHKRMQGGGEMA
jgi:hypothetical protein